MTAWILIAVFLLPAVASFVHLLFAERPHWREANHESTGQAPPPGSTPEAVVQVYGARTWGLRGSVAMHTWIAAKRSGADHYVRYEVIGWRLRRGGSALARERGRPDARWFSNHPQLLVDLRGDGVDAVIEAVEAAVNDYPHQHEYRMFPGPNSNTFTAFVGRQVPQLGLHLPPTAIGKDFTDALLAPAPSGTGYQLSLYGLAGLTVARYEGLEVNLLGLSAGIGLDPLAIKLPGVGLWPPRPRRHSL